MRSSARCVFLTLLRDKPKNLHLAPLHAFHTKAKWKLHYNNLQLYFLLIGGFHLHLLVFRSRIYSHLQMTSSEGFQHHFSIISNFVCCDCNMKKNVAFLSLLMCWNEMIVQVPLELLVQIRVQLLLALEANWLDQNVIELELKLLI